MKTDDSKEKTMRKTILGARLAMCAAVVALALVAVPAAAQTCHFNTYVDGSLCVGLDCVCGGGGFGFDTIQLKENNLRIKFQDTSVAASFPTRDWQILVNDSANGGLNRFSIVDVDGGTTPFTIEGDGNGSGSVPNNALYVDNAGNVGFGTGNPVVELHSVDGNTPTLRLEQDGSSGFTPQTWDVAGNETNFFIRDVTNGSTLPLRIQPGTGSNTLYLANDEQVGMGTNGPDAALEVRATATSIGAGNVVVKASNPSGPVAIQFDAADDGSFWNISHLDSNDNFQVSKSGTGATELVLTTAGNLTITGDLVTGGAGNCAPPNPACDGVFLPDYELETIEEHAAAMWGNSHLPAVGPTLPDQPINLTAKTQGILNELEKAHIYIEQLNETIKRLEQRLDGIESQ